MKLVVFFLAVVTSSAMLISMEHSTESEDTGTKERCVNEGEFIITSEMLDRFSDLALEVAESNLEQAREKSDSTLLLQALSNVANEAIYAHNHSRALECITEALQLKPSSTWNFIAMAGESLVHLSKSAYDLKISNKELVAQELYAIFYSYCRSASISQNNAHPLKNYIELVLGSDGLNLTYSGWSLVKYCRYIATQFHYQKCKDRLLTLINNLTQNGAVDEAFQENEEIPGALTCFSLKGGKPPVKGEVQNFKYVEVFPKNDKGAGPRKIRFAGKNRWAGVMVSYAIEPNPHYNGSYNTKQPKFYRKAAKQFEFQFQTNNNNEPEEFEFNFGKEQYTASKYN